MSEELDYMRFLELQRDMEITGMIRELDIPTKESFPLMSAQEDAEWRKRTEHFKSIREAAIEEWRNGGCCGHEQYRNDRSGFCDAACGGCYKHEMGLILAMSEWQWLEAQGDEDLSPWTRAIHLERLLKEMDDDAERADDETI